MELDWKRTWWGPAVVATGLLLVVGHVDSTESMAAEKSRSQMARAGYPQRVAPWARLSSGKRHRGYYVGGGAVSGGDSRDVRREGEVARTTVLDVIASRDQGDGEVGDFPAFDALPERVR